MGNKSRPQLTLSILLMAALCLEADIIHTSIFCPDRTLNWTEARQYCQKFHVDMPSWETMKRYQLADWLTEIKISKIWIGLYRDPKNDSIWRWIDLKTGEGISGGDVSNSSNWANGQQSRHCALVLEERQMWHSARCSEEHQVYCSVGDKIQYHKVDLSWYNASNYCQNRTSDLATITKTNKAALDKDGWIGLYRVAADTWSWIRDTPSQYRNWARTQPHVRDCALFDRDTKKWHSNSCSEKFHFVCSDDNLVVVNENKTWEDAMVHCRNMESPSKCVDSSGTCEYRYDLLSLNYTSDDIYVRGRINRATTDEVWTGLRFLGGQWWWVNGEVVKDPEMLPDCPPKGKHCGTLSKYNTAKWITGDCSEGRNFVCYKYKTLM